MSTYTITLKDSSDNVILPKTRTSAVYDNNNNRLDNILAEIDTQIDGKANASHTHDDRYYTETETDTKLSEKVDNSDYTKGEIISKLDEPSTWTQSNITYGDFACVYYGGGTWVAGGSSAKGLCYSTDGMTWAQSNVTTGKFNSVYYGVNKWVAGGDNATGLYYSTDGETWTQSNITSGPFTSVYYGGNKWVAAGTSDGLYYSTDGETWTQSNITSSIFDCVYYGGGKWVAGVGNSSYGGLYYSTDGMTWTQSNITSGSFHSVHYGGGKWVAADGRGNSSAKGLYYSTDGMTWTQSNITSGSFVSVHYGGGKWVAGGSSAKGLYYSTDGMAWTQSNITYGSFASVYYGGNKWVAGSSDYAGLYYPIPPYVPISDWNALLTMSSQYSITLANGESNKTASVSDFIEDITNYVYIPIIISSSNGTPVSIQIDHTNKLAMITRGVGVSSTSEISISYKILKIKIS